MDDDFDDQDFDSEDGGGEQLSFVFLNPLDLSDDCWEAIRKLAKSKLKQYNCKYDRAIVLAYFHYFELFDGSDTIN